MNQPKANLLVAGWLCSLLTALPGQEPPVATPFRDGERIVFFGDSITHGGMYLYHLQTFYATRFPERRIAFENAGIAGASVPGSLARLDRDVLARKPSRVLLAFGMNDVNRWFYATEPADEQLAYNRAGGIEWFGTKLKEGIGRSRAAGVAAEVLTPTPYDQYNRVLPPGEGLVSCNDGLAKLSLTARKIAGECGSPTIDLHTPLTAILIAHPDLTWAGDRIHPRGPGYQMMMRTIVAAQGITGPVAGLTLDAKGRKLVSATNCAVSGIAADGAGLRFTYQAKSLPFPVDDDYHEADRFLPWKDLNAETIRVSGLAAGAWKLQVGEVVVGSFSDQELAAGVDIAGRDTPQQLRARAIAQAVVRKAQADQPLRTREQVLGQMQDAKVDGEDRAAADAFMEQKLAAAGGMRGYLEQCFTAFRDCRERLVAIRQEVDDAQAAITALQKVDPLTIRIIR
jgi:lysophospholipase L1-like esterase